MVTKGFHLGTKKQHSATSPRLSERNQFNFCSDCQGWFLPLPVSGGKDGNPPDRYALVELTGNQANDLANINFLSDQGFRFASLMPFNYVLMGNYKENK